MPTQPNGTTPLQELLSGVPDAFVALDATGCVTALNPVAEAMLRPNLIGQVWWDVYPELRGSAAQAQFHQALQARDQRRLLLNLAPSGRWYTAQLFPYAGGLGVLLRETTDERLGARRRAALQEVATRLVGALSRDEVAEVLVEQSAAVVEAYGSVVCGLDGQHLTLLSAHGYERADLQAWQAFAVTAPVPIARAAQTGEALFLSRQSHQALFPEMPLLPATQSMVALPMRVHDRVTGAIGFSFDHARPFDPQERAFLLALADQAALALERVRLLEQADGHIAQLEAQEARLGAVLDQLPVTVMLAEMPGGRILAGNRTIQTLMRRPFIPAQSVEQYHHYTGYHPDGQAYTAQEWPLARTVTRGEVVEDEVIEMQRGDGSRTFISFNSSLVRAEDGTPIYAVAVGQDVSERQRAAQVLAAWSSELERQVQARTQELQAANAEQEAFTHMVSHDLRTPLRHIKGFLGLLDKQAPELNPAARRHLGTIGAAAERMDVMIEQLLAFARRSRQPLQREQVDLRPLVEDIWAELGPDRADRPIAWVVGDLPGVQADRLLLRYALTNLLSNAVKFTRGREPGRIEVSATQDDHETVVQVRDNGAGFDQRYADRLFGAFQRLHRDDEFEGVGIGLANVQRIIGRHGGRVWAEGQPGAGASFWLSLPRHPS